MRVIQQITFPTATFNAAVRDGSVSAKISSILEVVRPEAVYFTEHTGRRGATVVVQLDNNSSLPQVCEPWFLNFDATVESRIAMTPDDLRKADLEQFLGSD